MRERTEPMWKALLILFTAAALLGGAACKSSGGGAQTYSVQVDGRATDFLAAFLAYFPNDVQAHPGDTVGFTSIYSGEPHTVTLGSDVDAIYALIAQACPNGGLADPNCANGPPAQYVDQANTLDGKLPNLAPQGSPDFTQSAAQPCFLTTGGAPADGSACPKNEQTQPDFIGTQTYYNSGFLPAAAVFTVKLSKDIKPGTYHYFCLLHREGMSGTITVVDSKTKVPSPSEAKTRGDSELSQMVTKLKPTADKLAALTKDTAQAGASSPDVQEAGVAEFGPKEIDIKQGDSVTWTIDGAHTISFNTPADAKTFITKSADGGYHVNMKAAAPSNSPGQPADPSASPLIDAGAWDGTTFLNSGFIASSGSPSYQYKVTFSKAGTYNYECIVHPGMGGKVVVSQ
jgi:plastocyanin